MTSTDANESISAAGNYELTSQPLDIYLCPSMRLNGQPATFGEGSYIISYATKYRPKLNGSTVDGAFDEAPASPSQTYRLGLQAIADGTSNTFFFGEIDNSVRWTGSSASPGAWGHYTWAQGYWFNAQSHVEGKYKLIRVNRLPESYVEQLNPYVRQTFSELWQAAQVEEDY